MAEPRKFEFTSQCFVCKINTKFPISPHGDPLLCVCDHLKPKGLDYHINLQKNVAVIFLPNRKIFSILRTFYLLTAISRLTKNALP